MKVESRLELSLGAFTLRGAAASRTGTLHEGRGESNQDSMDRSLLGKPTAGALFLLADGAGGIKGGQVASSITVQTVIQRAALLDQAPRALDDISGWFKGAFQAAAMELQTIALADDTLKDMATTAEGLWFVDDRVYSVHLGDSRLYRCRSGGSLERLTMDHNLENDPDIPPLQRLNHIASGIPVETISRYIRVGKAHKPDFRSYDIQSGDVFVMVTDGAYKIPNLEAVIRSSNDPTQIANAILLSADAHALNDDATAWVVGVD